MIHSLPALQAQDGQKGGDSELPPGIINPGWPNYRRASFILHTSPCSCLAHCTHSAHLHPHLMMAPLVRIAGAPLHLCLSIALRALAHNPTNAQPFIRPAIKCGRVNSMSMPCLRAWWYITVLGAAWTGLMKPYIIAYEAHPGERCGHIVMSCCYGVTLSFGQSYSPCCCPDRPFTDTAGVIEYCLTAIFAVDMYLMFRVAYRDNEAYVIDKRKLASKYFECAPSVCACWSARRECRTGACCRIWLICESSRWRFWVDLIALVPLDYIVLALADRTNQGHWLVWANCARVLRMVSRALPQLP